jgi:hypothetical protein
MDLFYYIREYRVLACRRCSAGIAPTHLVTHVYEQHRGYIQEFSSRKTIAQWIEVQLLPSLSHGLVDPATEALVFPPTDADPLPVLKVFAGTGCNHCPFVTKSERVVRQHYNVHHAPIRRQRGGAKSTARGQLRERLDREHFGEGISWSPASYQRLLNWTAKGTRQCFRVKLSVLGLAPRRAQRRQEQASYLDRGQYIANEVLETLAELEAVQSQQQNFISDCAAKSQVSPWLERTRWRQYLNGVELSKAVALARLPDPIQETVLVEVAGAIDRLVQTAYVSVCEDKVNFFGQKRITSFLPKREAYSRPLVVKLQQATYQQYKQTWKRALAFVCRTSNPTQQTQLRHCLNSRQTASLDNLLALGAKQVANKTLPSHALDRACLDLCISLLDHRLSGDIFESALVGFLAVLGIDEANAAFYEAPNYTPKLSGFIKITQLLVLQQAVYAVEDGRSDDPLEPLDDMRERFMLLDTSTPFSWAISLRSYGKRIRDSTTSLGYIQWSEDGQRLSYRDLELSIQEFQLFVCTQVQKAQQLLEKLFLLSVDEQRADTVPTLALGRIRDNPTNIENGWNFLKDKRNQGILPQRDTWLLQRVLQDDRLRDEFCSLDNQQRVVWEPRVIQSYLRQVDAFLESLLLLVHISAGQPARGTEITSLQHTNTIFYRNIFIEDGLVALVTSYHKGYTCTGTTKIIHRYLPREISELLIYYLWLILPFIQKIELLQAKQAGSRVPPSPFLWSYKGEAWSSQRLSTVMKRETSLQFKAPFAISTYRHIAIAISRRHLNGGGFRRDYDVEDGVSDRQTTHTSWTAGRLYARGLEEAPGHVEARRAGFRAVSRRWHSFLGFATPTMSQKRPLEDITNKDYSKRRKEYTIDDEERQGEARKELASV